MAARLEHCALAHIPLAAGPRSAKPAAHARHGAAVPIGTKKVVEQFGNGPKVGAPPTILQLHYLICKVIQLQCSFDFVGAQPQSVP